MKRIVFFIGILVFSVNSIKLYSQEEVADFLKFGLSEAEKMVEAYITPAGKSICAGLGTGWYTSAKPHKLGGFDLTFGLSLITIPSADRMFNPEALNIEGLTSDPEETPTLVGDKDAQPATITIDKIPGVTNDDPVQFQAPAAVLNKMPVPMANLAIGLPKGTEIIGRFIPNINIKEYGQVGLWGIGIKHDVFQWLPAVDRIPIDLSIMSGYTKCYFTSNKASITPELVADNYIAVFAPPAVAPLWDNQEIGITASAFTANIIVSKKIAVITPYLGLGIIAGKFNGSLLGEYPIPRIQSDNTQPYFGETIVDNEDILTDPIDIEVKSTMVNATLGLRLKLAIFAFHGQYTFQKYPIINFGFGFNFR